MLLNGLLCVGQPCPPSPPPHPEPRGIHPKHLVPGPDAVQVAVAPPGQRPSQPSPSFPTWRGPGSLSPCSCPLPCVQSSSSLWLGCLWAPTTTSGGNSRVLFLSLQPLPGRENLPFASSLWSLHLDPQAGGWAVLSPRLPCSCPGHPPARVQRWGGQRGACDLFALAP